MRKVSLGWLLPALLVALALAAVGCGGDDTTKSGSSKGTGGTVTGGGKVGEGKQGGSVTYLAAGDVDYLDPGQTYYSFAYAINYAVQRTAYGFDPKDANTPIPDLAEGPPEIAADNLSVSFTVKPGVKYAPPVNREVKAEDIKYAIERAFTSNVPSGYASSYFAEIEGAPETPGKYKEIPGIVVEGNKITLKLTKAVAPRVAAALVMPITMPVPKEYAEPFDAKNPSTYDQYVAFSGPYMVKNDAKGKVTGRQPGKRIELVRNPNWDKATDFRKAYLDSITIEEGNDDLTVASRRTLAGQKLLCCDAGQPPIPILRRALQRNKDQVGRVAGGGTRWIAMNSTQKPFDNLNVRKAVIAGFDRTALRLTRGGEEVGAIAMHWIPPGIPGFEESGGEKGFTEFDWMQNPEGDAEVSKKYMLAAKEEGVPVSADGKYAGKDRLLTIATNADPGLKTAQTAQTEFEKLGFTLNFRKVPQDTLYTKFCGVPKAAVVICPNVGWFKDFQDPESMLQPTFCGCAIKPAGNVNWTQLADDAIDKAMTDAAVVPLGDERNKAWAEINKQIVAQAPGIPYVWDDTITISSPDLQMVINGYWTGPDLSFTSVK
jgi:peptide/nickel transport system substrate-binding protein